jgi:hypothetical protein
VTPSVDLDAEEWKKSLVFTGNHTPEVRCVACHYADCAIPVPDTRFILLINILLPFKQGSSKRSTLFISRFDRKCQLKI